MMRAAKNVFQIWYENGQKVPFVVQKLEWHRDSFFKVTEVQLSPKDWKHFKDTGDLYGKAFGLLFRHGEKFGQNAPAELANPGVYKWRLVTEETVDYPS